MTIGAPAHLCVCVPCRRRRIDHLYVCYALLLADNPFALFPQISAHSYFDAIAPFFLSYPRAIDLAFFPSLHAAKSPQAWKYFEWSLNHLRGSTVGYNYGVLYSFPLFVLCFSGLRVCISAFDIVSIWKKVADFPTVCDFNYILLLPYQQTTRLCFHVLCLLLDSNTSWKVPFTFLVFVALEVLQISSSRRTQSDFLPALLTAYPSAYGNLGTKCSTLYWGHPLPTTWIRTRGCAVRECLCYHSANHSIGHFS